MKPLKPSHREKKRYLLIKGNDNTKENIEKVILDFIGILGYGEAGSQIIKSAKNYLILAVNHNMVDKIRTCFLMSGKDIQIVKVSGSIKKLKIL